jgi:hypothetical protein
MPLSVAQVFEVRTTGNDANGGGCKAGAGGTDYSQQDAPQVVVDNSTITATTAGANSNVITFVGYTPTSADVGNVFQAAGGTNINAGFYEITGFTSTAWTVSGAANLTTAGGAGSAITGRMGGALATLGKLASAMVAGNKAFVKSGTYALTAGATFSQSVTTPSETAPPSRLIGYASVRGDITESSANQSSRPTIVANAGGLIGLNFSGAGWIVRNLIAQSGTSAFSVGIQATGNFALLHNCKASGCTSYGLVANGGGNARIEFCEVANQAGGNCLYIVGGSVSRCYVHDATSSSVGISAPGGYVRDCVFANLSGASADAVQLSGAGSVERCTFNNVGRHGVNLSNFRYGYTTVRNNIFALCGGYGVTDTTGAGVPPEPEWDGNAFYLNTSGNIGPNMQDAGAVNAVDGVSPYSYSRNVFCTADPFVASASADYRLNSNAGGGAACRAAGIPGTLPGLSPLGYADFGALQHQDAGGSTSVFVVEG